MSLARVLGKLLLALDAVSADQSSSIVSSVQLHYAVVDLNRIKETVVDLLALTVNLCLLSHFYILKPNLLFITSLHLE